MLVSMLRAKLHQARVTGADLDYVGSITIDSALLEQVGMRPYERVLIADIENGARFETYVFVGEEDSGTICLNGPAARLGQVGDLVIIISYCQLEFEEAKKYQPRVVYVDEENRILTRK